MFRNWLSRATRLELLLVSAIFAVVVWLVDSGLDLVMIHFDSTRRELLFFSDAATAILAGALMLWVLLLQRTRRLETEERMEVIREMNHHVRNALQVISYWGVQERDRQQLSFIHDAVDRIEWALRDVLPRGVARKQPRSYNPKHESPAAVPGRRH